MLRCVIVAITSLLGLDAATLRADPVVSQATTLSQERLKSFLPTNKTDSVALAQVAATVSQKLKAAGRHLKTDAVYFGVEFRVELNKPLTPGIDVMIFYVGCSGLEEEMCNTKTDHKFCLATTVGMDYELNQKWGMAEFDKPKDWDMMFILGGVRWSDLPNKNETKPFMEIGGEVTYGKKVRVDGTAGLTLQADKNFFMAGVEFSSPALQRAFKNWFKGPTEEQKKGTWSARLFQEFRKAEHELVEEIPVIGKLVKNVGHKVIQDTFTIAGGNAVDLTASVQGGAEAITEVFTGQTLIEAVMNTKNIAAEVNSGTIWCIP